VSYDLVPNPNANNGIPYFGHFIALDGPFKLIIKLGPFPKQILHPSDTVVLCVVIITECILSFEHQKQMLDSIKN